MAQLIKLWDEKDLLIKLRSDTLIIVQNCQSIPPIKKLIECHDILDLSIQIIEQFPTQKEDGIPVGDSDALLQLKRLVQEIFVYYPTDVPRPAFDTYEMKVKTLLRIFRLPREEFCGIR